ncbi:hypothetical protein ACFVU2_09215 [Leifsonia sp. NPDC058194]|uniref:hypothetical protein n=1 Tax=Leifsonia sp. NPDC058194 TaxID=3346374 RepID=UPI0036DBA80B
MSGAHTDGIATDGVAADGIASDGALTVGDQTATGGAPVVAPFSLIPLGDVSAAACDGDSCALPA